MCVEVGILMMLDAFGARVASQWFYIQPLALFLRGPQAGLL
jgi:hypothetical protein